MASESSVNGDFMQVDMVSNSSLSTHHVVSPIRRRPMGSFPLSPQALIELGASYRSAVQSSNVGQLFVIGLSEANRIILLGDPTPTLQLAGLAGSRLPPKIRVVGFSQNHPSSIRLNDVVLGRMEMPVEPGVLNPNSVGKNFCQKYYEYFDTRREMLTGLYDENSVLTFQGVKFLGAEAAVHLLECLPERWKPDVYDVDCCGSSDNVNVQVCGAMLTNSDWQLSGPALELLSPLIETTRSYFRFCQSFHLAKNLEGKYYVVNEIFRLIN